MLNNAMHMPAGSNPQWVVSYAERASAPSIISIAFCNP
jgi:hypothetical protein